MYAGPSIYHSHAPVEGTVEIGARSGKALRDGEDIKIYGPAVMDDGGPTGDGEERFGYWCRISPLHESPAWILRSDLHISGDSSWTSHTNDFLRRCQLWSSRWPGD